MRLPASDATATTRFPLWRRAARRASRGARRLLITAVLARAGLDAQTPAASTADASQPAAESREARLARTDRSRIRGRADAPVWIVVLSDYQCPFCKRWHDETEPLIDRDYIRTGKAQVAYLNFPITSSHPNAQPAHELAMCAAEQERFWPVSDALFRTQGEWKGLRTPRAFFDSLARSLPLDQARLQRCLTAGEVRELIAADLDRAQRIGVGSTPTFLIGGRPVIGAQPYEAFRRAIDAAIAAAPARP
ncbi:MAG: DsbA family protein [Gemmatimonadota bacterium]